MKDSPEEATSACSSSASPCNSPRIQVSYQKHFGSACLWIFTVIHLKSEEERTIWGEAFLFIYEDKVLKNVNKIRKRNTVNGLGG